MTSFGFGTRQLVRRATLLAGLMAAIGLAGATAADATSYMVTTTSDSSASGQCTLRDAMNAANGSVTPGSSCSTPGTGTDTIAFQSGLTPPTIMLGSSLPTIVSGETLTIQGPTTPGIAIDGGGKFRAMSVNSGATLNISDLTIANGNSGPQGGGILNGGTLKVTNCTFSGNSTLGQGGGIYNTGTLTVTNSTFSSNTAAFGGGGAIDNNFGTLKVTNSTFSGNSTTGGGDGGAIFGFGTFTNCTFSSNTATVGGAIDGGGIFTNSTFSGNSASDGGAILGGGTFTNCTFSSNTATVGGAILGGGTFTNCTFSGNHASLGGGIFNGGATATLKGTILASSPSGGNCDANPTITDGGYNLSDDDSCGFSGMGSQNGVTNLALGSLMNNGGSTDTFAITSSSSPAAAAIPSASCTDQASPPNQLTTDQRGYGRPVDGTCSAGAYQFNGPPPGALTVMPPSLSFPNTLVGTKSAAMQVTIENISAVSVDLNSITVGTANFAVDSSQCTSPLPASTSCTLNVTSTPTIAGPLTDTLSISDNVPGSPQTVALSGTGIFAGQPGKANCYGQSVSALATKYDGLSAAAAALGYPSVKALQAALGAFCAR
jgi:predicted outer membrane repeat protein